MITPIRSRYQSVVEIAKNLGFDMHRVPAKYYILSDWYMGNDCVALFDDNPIGDDEAIRWMKEQKGQEDTSKHDELFPHVPVSPSSPLEVKTDAL